MVDLRARVRRALTLATFLAATAYGCGDGVVIIGLNLGTVASVPVCGGTNGQFNMLTDGGLTLLIIIGDTTVISNSAGQPGRCTDLGFGQPVQVRGPQHGMQINAQSINVR